MRETYSLSDETRDVLTDNVKAIAVEWDKDKSYLYQILSNVECDPFSKFRSLYAAAVRAGVEVTAWDIALTSVKARYGSNKGEHTCIADTIRHHSEVVSKYVDALADGVISHTEAKEIRNAIQKSHDELNNLSVLLDIREEQRQGVEQRAAARRAA